MSAHEFASARSPWIPPRGDKAKAMSTLFALTFVDWVRQNWAALGIAGTCLSLVVFTVLVLKKYVGICINIFTDTPPPLAMGPRDFQVMQGEEIRFRSFGGASLRGMWLWSSAKTGYRGTIVFCHEFGSNMYSCARYARPLIDAGFDVFTFDFRCHGESSCQTEYRVLQWPSDKELEDVLGACAYVEDALEQAGKGRKIGLFGVSRGAGSGILAANSDPDIACMVCDGAFSTRETIVSLMKRWVHIFAKVRLVYENHPDVFWRLMCWLVMFVAQRKLKRRFLSVRKSLRDMASRPILFIHGGRDSYIRQEHSELLYETAAEPKYLWIVPTAKHNQAVIVAREEYAARTIAFFAKYLAGESVNEQELSAGLDRSDVA